MKKNTGNSDQASLLNDAPDSPQKGALTLGVADSTKPLSSAAKSFNLQLSRVEKLKEQLAELEALRLEFLPKFDAVLRPLEERNRAAVRSAACWIDERLQRKGLGKVQRQTAIDILCDMASQLAELGDPDMAALHDKYSQVSFSEVQASELTLFKDMLDEVMGEPFGDDQNQNFSSMEDLMQANAARFHKMQMEAEEARQKTLEKKQAKKKKTLAGQQAEQLQQDASGLLRQIFRQLASSLHPDRETDEALRIQKTALMSEANAAYDRKDLVALMQLQVRAALVDQAGAQRMSDEKLAALTLLLKQQVADLERERALKQRSLIHELNLPYGVQTGRNALQRYLADCQLNLQHECEDLEHDVVSWEYDALFKAWLNASRG